MLARVTPFARHTAPAAPRRNYACSEPSLGMGCDGRIRLALPGGRAGPVQRNGGLRPCPDGSGGARSRRSSLGMGCDDRIEIPLPPGVASLPAWRLRNGNLPFDLRRSRRCGARTRAGCPCRQPAMANGRCRLHGGKSTGARTAAGRERCRQARWRHGGCTLAFREMRKEGMRIRRNLRILCALAAGEIARCERRPPPTEYLRLLDATGKSPAELIAEVEANHWAAVRQGEATRRRRAEQARASPCGGERLAA